MRSTLFALAAGLAATTSAFDCSGHYFSFFNRAGAMSYQRLDPDLFPGTASPHLHAFEGSNSLSSSTDYADTQASMCTTARIKTDKSLYWRPALFFNNGTGFYRVPETSTKIYYKSGDGDKWANVTGFPEGFKMVAGDPFKRSDGDNPGGVRWGCHEADGSSNTIFTNGFPNGFSSCDQGFATEMTFPSCWNGKAIDPNNPNAHMAYPSGFSGVGIENCPITHRAARFPTIFIEFWYDISSFKGHFGPKDTPWSLANGDPTGFGFHADFLNGWEKGVLEKATGETGGCNCGCGCGQTEMEQCFGAENVNKDNDADWASCGVKGADSADASPFLKKLPGCNPPQYGPARATVVTGAGCDATATSASTSKKTSAPVSTSKKTSAAASSTKKTSAVASTSKKTSAVASSHAASRTSTPVTKVATTSSATTTGKSTRISSSSSTRGQRSSALPSISVKVPNKAVNNEYEVSAENLPTASLASSAAPADVTGSPSHGSPDGEKCQAAVYVTVTPTVYVTVGANANTTSYGGQTSTRTVYQTAVVTVPAAGGVQYGSY